MTTPSPPPAGTTGQRENFAWLVRMRWAALAGVVLVLPTAWIALGLVVPWAPLGTLVGIGAVSNVAAGVWNRRGRPVTDGTIAAVMVFDALLVTGGFYLTGGPENPFSFLFLVHVALASVILPPRLAWGIGALGVALFGLLFLDSVPLQMAGEHGGGHAHGADHGESMMLHLRGMWVAFAIAAGFLLVFISRVTRALAARERQLADAQRAAARAERLASLATLAAGAAHELATPLSTIAVVARELERDLGSLPDAEEAAGDARLIGEQVARCREVLEDLRADAGDPAGETPEPVRVDALLEAARALTRQPDRIRLAVDDPAPTVLAYRRSIVRVLRGLMQNGLDAGEGPVEAAVVAGADGVDVRVVDHGEGMAPDVLARVGEPFFTTKPTGRGMGLGVFLARSVAERLGGALHHESALGQGTTATLRLPSARGPDV